MIPVDDCFLRVQYDRRTTHRVVSSEYSREYCDLKGEEYVRSKADVVRLQPRRNAAGALLTALRDDWQPPVNIKGEKNMPSQRVVRPGNRNIGNSNEHCDFSQYRSSQ